MLRRWAPGFAVVAILIAVSLPCLAGTTLSDREIALAFVGSWVTSPDSSDRVNGSERLVEIYSADGIDRLYDYPEPNCQHRTLIAQAPWHVENGIVILSLPDGRLLKDEVVSIKGRLLTLHSLDDGSTYTRIKIDSGCRLGAMSDISW
jgi:hypothetical protein